LSSEQLDGRIGAMIGAERWAAVESRYRAAHEGRGAAALMAAVSTDLVFRAPALQLADGMAAADKAPVWMYRLDWPSPAAGGRLGATHALDIPFVWDLLDLPGVAQFTGEAPGRHRLARAMHAAWLAFATTGDPATPLLPPWPRYQPPGRATMLFDAECRVANDPDGSARQIGDGR
jgi:para-nitrobenzyl esterase